MDETSYYLENGKYARGVPRAVLANFAKRFSAKQHNGMTVREVMHAIHDLFPKTGYHTTTNNVRLSRLVSASKIFKLRLFTCGAFATVHAAVLRHLGYPTRLVDGKLRKHGEWGRHAWIEVYLPNAKRFVPFDPMVTGNRVSRYHRRTRAYRDWSELKLGRG